MLTVATAQTQILKALGESATVRAIAFHGNDVYIGGRFSSFKNFAKFNLLTGNFTAVANGSYDGIDCFLIRGNELFVGVANGYILTGDYGFNRLDLTTDQWIGVAPGFGDFTTYPDGVWDFALYQNELVIATTGPPYIVHYINGVYYNPTFTNNTKIFDGSSLALKNINGTLYAAGGFQRPCSNVARWDESIGNWTCVSTQNFTSGQSVWAIDGDGTNLFIGGAIPGGLARLNATGGWSVVNPIFSNDTYGNGNAIVFSLHIIAGDLYVGGNFNNEIYRFSISSGLVSNFTSSTGTVYLLRSDANYLYMAGDMYYGIQRFSLNPSNPTTTAIITRSFPENSSSKFCATIELLIMVFIALFAF